MDFENELGETLEHTLRLFSASPLYVEDLIRKDCIEIELASERIFCLVQYGYLRPASGQCNSLDDIDISDEYTITAIGTNYLELHKTLLKRLWENRAFKFAPIVISLISLFKSFWTEITFLLQLISEALAH